MNTNEKLLKISSDFCLKLLFSYLDYNSILKIVKNNKKLQKRLCLNINNYKNKFCYQYAEKKIVKKFYFDNDKRIRKNVGLKIYSLSSCFLIVLFFIYSLIISYSKDDNSHTNNNTVSDDFSSDLIFNSSKANLTTYETKGRNSIYYEVVFFYVFFASIFISLLLINVGYQKIITKIKEK